MVKSAPPVVGALSWARVLITGASYENNFPEVPTTAEIVSCILLEAPRFVVDPLLVHFTIVSVVQLEVTQAAALILTEGVRLTPTPKFTPERVTNDIPVITELSCRD